MKGEKLSNKDLPEGAAAHYLYSNECWELHLIIEKEDRDWIVSKRSTIRNIFPGKRALPLDTPASPDGLVFRIKQPSREPIRLRFVSEPLASGEMTSLRRNIDLISIDPARPFEIEQVAGISTRKAAEAVAKAAPDKAVRRDPEVLAVEEAVGTAVRVPLDLYVITTNEDGMPMLTVLEPPRGAKKGNPQKRPIPKPVLLQDLAKCKDPPARQLRPLRMAIIAGSFPYRQQLENFRTAMRLGTVEDVLTESVKADRDGDKIRVAAFRFLRVELQRREVDPKGSPAAEWTSIDLEENYRPWISASGKRFDLEPDQLQKVSMPGLVMPRLLQFPSKADNAAATDPDKEDFENHYPNLEEQLPKLARTLEELKGKGGIPDYCLVRVVDVTIEQGKTYQYRMRVRMGSPYQGHSTAARPELPRDPELPPSKWYEVPGRVALSPEVVYYAVDQKELGDNNDATTLVRPDANSTVLQVHKWMERPVVPSIKEREPVAIGEWVISERTIVHRGEYVDRTERAQLAVWVWYQNAFVLPNDPHGKRNKGETTEVSFSHGNKEGLETILVDFDGGKPTIRPGQPAPNRQEIAPTDVLLLTPDGRLIGRNSAADANDPERQMRQNAARQRFEVIKKAQSRPEKSTSPFGPSPFDKPGK
jgi:hypothetical protein